MKWRKAEVTLFHLPGMGLDKTAMLQRGSRWNMFPRPKCMPLVTYGFALCDAVMKASRYCSFCIYYIRRNVSQKFIKDVHTMLLCCSRPSCCEIWTECDESTEKQHKVCPQTMSFFNTFIRPVTCRRFTGQHLISQLVLENNIC